MSASSTPGFSGGPYYLERRLIKTKRTQLVSLYMCGGFFGGEGEVNKSSVLLWGFLLEALLAVVKHACDSCG